MLLSAHIIIASLPSEMTMFSNSIHVVLFWKDNVGKTCYVSFIFTCPVAEVSACEVEENILTLYVPEGTFQPITGYTEVLYLLEYK